MSRIFWDTNLFIYLLEGSREKFPLVRHLLERMIERRDELLTSSLTLGEVLVRPLEMDRQDLIDRYERLLNSPGVSLVPFDERSARIYAQLRQDRGIRPPDAIQLSCAAAARTNLFITNDTRLNQKKVDGVDFVVSLEQVFL